MTIKIEVELFTDQGNNAVVRLPERNFPGVLVQGDSFSNLLSSISEARALLGRGENSTAGGLLRSLEEDLQHVLDRYESALREHEIALPSALEKTADTKDQTEANLAALATTKPPWLFSVNATAPNPPDFCWAVQQQLGPNGVVRQLRGRKMKTVDALFDEVSAALQFPSYFGENWNAFDECLADLSWLPAASYVLVIDEAAQLLCDEVPEQLSTFVDVLTLVGAEWANRRQTGNEWDRPATPFHVVFQCLEADQPRLVERIKAAGGELAPLLVNH